MKWRLDVIIIFSNHRDKDIIYFEIVFVSIILLFSYKTKPMHKYLTTIIFSIILFVVVLCTAYNYHNNTVLESRINTALKFSGDIKSEKSFKEDYYILQQSHDTNLILVVFGLAVAVMGFFTYRSVVERFDYKLWNFYQNLHPLKKY